MNKISPSIPILNIPISLEEGAANNDIIFPSLPWSSLSVGTRDHFHKNAFGKTHIASQEGRYVLPQRVALESNALLNQPIGVELLSTRCFRKQHVAYIRSDTTRCFHF